MADYKDPDEFYEARIAPALSALSGKVDAVLTALASAEDKPRLSLVRNSDTGEIWAYGPGQFDRISSMDELDYGRNIGLYTRSPWLDTDTAGIAVFRGLALEGSAADPSKGV